MFINRCCRHNILLILLLLACIIGWGNVAWAATVPISPTSTPDRDKTMVRVYLNGELIDFDVNPIIEDGRILVPMAAIFKAVGADIIWDGDTQTVTACKGDTTIILPIGSLTPNVNGQICILDVPAKIVENRTLVPLRFVGQALGGKVAWDTETYRAIILCPPNQDNELIAVKVNGGTVNLRTNPSTSADVIAVLSQDMELDVYGEQGGWYKVNYQGEEAWVAGWVITPVWAAVNGSSTTTPGGSPTMPNGESLTINYNKAADGIYLTLQGNRQAKVEKENGVLTYTFTDSYLQAKTDIKEPVESACISISGFNQGEDAVVEVTIPPFLTYEKRKENNGKTQTIFIPNCITGMVRQTFSTSGERIDITTLLPVTYTQQQSRDTMDITFSGLRQGLAQSSYSCDSQSIKNLTFEEQTNESFSNTLLTITTKKAAKFSIRQNSAGTQTHILLINQRDISDPTPLVVLDPGHGGKDPGACGCFSKEKDINLAVALKVGAILVQKGIRVEYIRSTDIFVPLECETETANIMDAALFVAIHCNWANPNVKGTETFYYAPESDLNLYLQKDDRKNLATAVQQRLAASLGRPDRGVKEENLLVLRNTRMPSALTELAFISNSEEEDLLNQDAFQNIAAQAIAEAIAECMPAIDEKAPSF